MNPDNYSIVKVKSKVYHLYKKSYSIRDKDQLIATGDITEIHSLISLMDKGYHIMGQL